MKIVSKRRIIFFTKIMTQPTKRQVHFCQAICCTFLFLSVNIYAADIAPLGLHNIRTLNKHTAAAAAWVKQDVNSDTPAIEKNFTPVRDAYAALWKEYKEATSSTVIMRTARQILEYYFIQISGYEGQTLADRIMKRKDDFLEIAPDGTENREKQHLLNALLRYIGAENQRFNDGLDYVEDTESVEQIRYTFKLIFDVMEQSQHYDMMMDPA